MNNLFYTLVVFFLASCAEQELCEGIPDVQKSETVVNDQFVSLLEQARWGDGKACLKLAKMYHDGVGVKPDFMNSVTMLMMAEQYGEKHGSLSFMKALPQMDRMKLIYDSFDRLGTRHFSSADSIADALISQGSENGYVLKGVVQIQRGDTLEGRKAIEIGAEKGSSLGELVLCAVSSLGKQNGRSGVLAKLSALSERIPMANRLLADMYSGYEGIDMIDEPLAEKYYLKADRRGCLGKRPARWLINYYDRNGIQIDSMEMRRLQILSGYVNDPDEYIPDSVKVDSDYLEIDTVAVK
ncbi:MAG: hypothetical protein IJV17_01120 [Prevotella sp.]|nr:hypothetical protein [Prevotella sp.]